MTPECYIANLQLPFPQFNQSNIERAELAKLVLGGENLGPRVGNDIRVEPVRETKFFPLQEVKASRWG